MYSLAFSGLFVGIAVRFSGCQDAIGPDDEDEMVNLYHLWDRRVHYYYNLSLHLEKMFGEKGEIGGDSKAKKVEHLGGLKYFRVSPRKSRCEGREGQSCNREAQSDGFLCRYKATHYNYIYIILLIKLVTSNG